MSTRIYKTRTDRSGAVGQADFKDIHSLPESPLEPKSRALSRPDDVEAYLLPSLELPNAVAPLMHIIGPAMTVDSPAWSGDPIPGMRMLQKTLVATSLQLDEGDRKELLTAIELVEKAVHMRLRWQQMRRSEVELLINPSKEEKHAVKAEKAET